MRSSLEQRLSQLEAKAKPPIVETWVDLMLWLDEHEGDERSAEIELSPQMEVLVQMMLSDSDQDDE